MFDDDLKNAATARRLACDLCNRDKADRDDLMALIIRENHGSLHNPAGPGNQGTHMFEIHALETYGTGATLDEAITSWCRAAERTAPMHPARASTTDAHTGGF